MPKKIASARILTKSSKLLKQLNNSLHFDNILYEEDIDGSLAHSFMLYKQNIISLEDYNKIQKGLKEIKIEIENKTFKLDSDFEDIHMAIESYLTDKIGDAGKKLHTARSRNDQIATDFRLFVQKKNIEISNLLIINIKTFTDKAEKYIDVILPGTTHLQHAQPINLGYYLIAYANMFKRDYERFKNSYDRNNLSPLGCAALAGTPHDIDRDETSNKLGFKEPTANCLDTVSDRDFALEILFNISVLMMHISRLSEELILWSSPKFNFIKLDDKHSTGSSIMPQKKNPDIPELLRAKTGRVNGNLISLLTVMKGLPLAYNKDMQEDKESVFDSVKTSILSLQILDEMIFDMKINIKNMEEACLIGHLTATDLADGLVNFLKIPFRDAYHITGDVVNLAEEKNIDISELSLKDLQKIDNRINIEISNLLDNRKSMNSRNSKGGTSKKRTLEQINDMKYFITKNKK